MATNPQKTGSHAFGPYRLERRVAQGGMAEAWKARWQGAAGVQRQVLIKRIKTTISSDPKFVQMFISEAHVSAGLTHGNIAQVFDFGEVDGEYYLAMEFIDGPSLAQLIKRCVELGRKVPAPLALYIAMEMAKGLHYAHMARDEQGKPLHIVHRDVSPENVLVSYEGQVKLIDFGIARARLAVRAETEAGIVRGKFLYFSPEQSRGEMVDAQTDVWAVGVVLYFMVCGRLPMTGQAYEVIRKIQFGEFPKPSVVTPEISEELEGVIMKSLALQKSNRFRSAQAFHDAMGEILHRDYPGISSAYLAAYLSELFTEELAKKGQSVEVSAPVAAGLKAMKTGQTKSRAYKQPTGQQPAVVETNAKSKSQAVQVPTAPVPVDPATRKLMIALAAVLSIGVVVAGLGAIVYVRGLKPSKAIDPSLTVETWQTTGARRIAQIRARPTTQALAIAYGPVLDEMKTAMGTLTDEKRASTEREIAFIDALFGGPQLTGDAHVLWEKWLTERAELMLAQDNFASAMATFEKCTGCPKVEARRAELAPEEPSFEALVTARKALDVGDATGAKAALERATDTLLYQLRFEKLTERYFSLAQIQNPPPDYFVVDLKRSIQLSERLDRLSKPAAAKGSAMAKRLAEVKSQANAASTARAVKAVDETLKTLESEFSDLPPILNAEQQDKVLSQMATEARAAARNQEWSSAQRQVDRCLKANPNYVECLSVAMSVAQHFNTADWTPLCRRYLAHAPPEDTVAAIYRRKQCAR